VHSTVVIKSKGNNITEYTAVFTIQNIYIYIYIYCKAIPTFIKIYLRNVTTCFGYPEKLVNGYSR
jgi:hypothetical protein